MFALVVGQTPGLSSLVYVLAGYAVGRLGMMRDPESRVLPLLVGIVGTLAKAKISPRAKTAEEPQPAPDPVGRNA